MNKALLLALALMIVGCSNVMGPEKDLLAAARSRWAKVSANSYTFEFQRSCFCLPELLRTIRVNVTVGKENSAVYVDTGEPATAPLITIPTIDALFDEIQDAINREAHLVIAEYDSQLGFPKSVSIDYIREAADDEMAFSVSAFHLLDISCDLKSSLSRTGEATWPTLCARESS